MNDPEKKTLNDLPPVTQQPIIHVDGTPDDEYPLRILKAYRENCNCKWVITNNESVFVKIMNEACDKRVKILDRAITILERFKHE